MAWAGWSVPDWPACVCMCVCQWVVGVTGVRESCMGESVPSSRPYAPPIGEPAPEIAWNAAARWLCCERCYKRASE